MSTRVDLTTQVTERPATALDEGLFRQLFVADRLPELLGALPRAQAEALVVDQFRLQTVGYAEQFPHASHRVVAFRGRPVGRVIDAEVGDHLLLVDIVLDPSVRGLGIGTEVVHRLQERARATGRPVHLHVRIGSPAIRLYSSLGFEPGAPAGDRIEMTWTP